MDTFEYIKFICDADSRTTSTKYEQAIFNELIGSVMGTYEVYLAQEKLRRQGNMWNEDGEFTGAVYIDDYVEERDEYNPDVEMDRRIEREY